MPINTSTASCVGAASIAELRQTKVALKLNPTVSAKRLRQYIEEETGVVLHERSLSRGLVIARQETTNQANDALLDLGARVAAFQELNPNVKVCLEVTREDHFRHFSLFLNFTRDQLDCLLNVVFVDGAFIKNIVFRHVILCIAALDTNHKLVVLALGIAPCENAANWEWFLRQLLGTPLGDAISERIFLMMADRDGGLYCAFKLVFRNGVLTNCCVHLIRNMKRAQVKGNKHLFLKVAYASTLLERDLLLAELHQKEPAVAEWLGQNLHGTQWQTAALGELGFKTYGIVTNNTAECLFAKLCVPAVHDLAMRQMTAGPMVISMMELLQGQANVVRDRARSSSTYIHRFSMYAIRDFMTEANDSVNYTCEERGSNEWIVRRKDDKGGIFEAFRIVRRDETLELGYECECGRAEQRDIMCRHIISVIKGSALRRTLLKAGGIGAKWSTEKFKVFADFEVRAPSGNEILAKQTQTLFPTKILLPKVNWRRGRPKKERALSASEKYHRAGLKKANLPLDSKVVVCGICQQPGHNRRTCQRMQNFLADRAADDMFEGCD
jgi:hypothetical protein